jgi:hypothetical protein
LAPAAVHQNRYLRVRIHVHKAAAELLALADVDQPGVVLGAAVAEGEQLFQHHGHFHAVGRAARIELQGVLADGQLRIMRRPGNRPIDTRVPPFFARARPFPFPDLGGV